MIAFDTETRNLRWWEGSAFLATWSGPTANHYAPLVDHPTQAAGGVREANADYFLRALAQHDELLALNAKFDAHQLRETLGYDILENGHTLHDVALMARVLYSSSRWQYDLDTLGKDFLPGAGKADAKGDISAIYKRLKNRTSMAHDDSFWDVWVEDPDALERYAMADTRDTWDLFQVFWPQLQADERLLAAYQQELEIQAIIIRAEQRGVRIDQGAVERLKTYHADREAAAGARLSEALGVDPDQLEGDGSDDLLRSLLPAVGVPLTELTESGEKLAVNQKVLSAHQDHPAVSALLEWRQSRKFSSTYLEPLEGWTIVHTDFRQAEAKTSRMSSARPNLQNLPKRKDQDTETSMRVRGMYIPREGYEFGVADYDQIEPRLFAHYLGDPGYQELVAENRVYEDVCAAAWGNHPQGSSNPQDYAKGGSHEFLRPVGKMTYLAILYGGGGRAVRDQVNAMAPPEFHLDIGWVKDPTNKFDTPPEAQALKKRILSTIPGYWDLAGQGTKWSDPGRLVETADRLGHIRTLMGRKQFLQRSDDGEALYYKLLNQLIQGSAAEVLKAGAIEVDKFLRPYDGHLILFVHDELVCELPEGTGHELMPQVADIMAGVADVNPALTAEWSVTKESYAHA